MNYFFTSDWHLGHDTILKGFRKEVFSSTDEMNKKIISNIFEVIKPGDQLYYLGDMYWKFPQDELDKLFIAFKKHKINFHFITGNHDPKHLKYSAIVWQGTLKDIVINKQPITLCHYPMVVWNKSHYNAWQLHGHIHYKDSTWFKLFERDIYEGKQINVNCELHNFMPLSFEELFELMKNKNDNFDLIRR